MHSSLTFEKEILGEATAANDNWVDAKPGDNDHYHVVPMEITFMDMEDNHLKYGTLRSVRYVYSNRFRFLISFLASPTSFLRIAKR